MESFNKKLLITLITSHVFHLQGPHSIIFSTSPQSYIYIYNLKVVEGKVVKRVSFALWTHNRWSKWSQGKTGHHFFCVLSMFQVMPNFSMPAAFLYARINSSRKIIGATITSRSRTSRLNRLLSLIIHIHFCGDEKCLFISCFYNHIKI